MKIVLYQIVPELDAENLIFRDFHQHGNSQIPSEIYEMVYQGNLDVQTPEEVFEIFNLNPPEGYKSRSMSVADVVEFTYSPEHSDFFFCNTIGFTKVDFDKKRSMLPIVNHDYQKVEDIREGRFAIAFRGEFGVQLGMCSKVMLTRCRYSQCQLGYRLTYWSPGTERSHTTDFLTKPKILLAYTGGRRIPESVFDRRPDKRTRISRYAVSDDEKFEAVERWCQKFAIRFEYLLDS